MNRNTRSIAVFGLLVALAFIFSYIESLLPVFGQVPGVKLGLANIVVIIAIYRLGSKEAFFIAMIRILLVGFTFGNLMMMMYSMAGGILSCMTMILLKYSKKFSLVGVSISGGVMHNVGQILMAILILETVELYHYLPVLIISGLVTGIVIGIVGAEITKRLPANLTN